LKTKLIDALADEAYEKAAKIRDELSRRKSS
jgi:protein-arginine kinase activator protein McsA